MGLLGTDVKKEELEEIRLLEAERAISSYAEKKIDSLLEKTNATKDFLANLLVNDTSLNEKIVNAIRSSEDDFIIPLQRLISELRTSMSVLDEDRNEINRLFELGRRVMSLINDVESKQSKKSQFLTIKGKKVVEQVKKLEEAEKRQILTKFRSLAVILTNLLEAGRAVYGTIKNLQTAVGEYMEAKKLLREVENEVTQRLAAKHIANMKNELRNAKNELVSANVALGNAKMIIEKFKDYLNTAEKESEDALLYEQALANMHK